MIEQAKSIFILEDDPERIKWFAQRFVGVPVLHFASEPGAAIKYLQDHDYDVIFLDHDLEAAHYGPYNENLMGTGHDVAAWMETNNVQRQALIIVHSLNPAGSDRIMRTLDKWRPVRCPFTALMALVSLPNQKEKA